MILVLLAVGPRRLTLSREIICNLAPFVLMLAALLLINTVSVLRELTFKKLTVTINVVPIHPITY
jgi:hypothetical protein